MSDPLLEANNLSIEYHTDRGRLKAVTDVSFTLSEGENFGLVGESGCGKSTIAKAIIGGLDSNGRIASGEIRYKGKEIHTYSESRLNEEIRWKEIAFVPQGSMDNLDPIERLSDQAIEVAATHTDLEADEALDKFRDVFERVGLPPDRIHEYPHQFSGGMQQRAVIALALFLDPSLLIADEPTTALDVIMQDQVFRYLEEVDDQDRGMLLITHDIGVVFESCSRMGIMHGGQLAETGSVESIYDDPRHPYSILLQESFPSIESPGRDLSGIDGNPPELWDEVDYCSFHNRCPWAVEECTAQAPVAESVDGSPGQQVACFRSDEVRDLYDAEQFGPSARMGEE